MPSHSPSPFVAELCSTTNFNGSVCLCPLPDFSLAQPP